MLAKYAVYYTATKFLSWYYFWVGGRLVGWFVLFGIFKKTPDKRQSDEVTLNSKLKHKSALIDGLL